MSLETETKQPIQILGYNLSAAMRDLNIDATLKYSTGLKENEPRRPSFEAWEMSEEVFEAFCNVDDEDWKNDYGWWRYGERASEDFSATYIVNGHEMIGYPNESWENDEDEDEPGPDSYEDFLEYLDLNQGLSTEKNIAITAISLAKANNLTLAEFMEKYYG